MDGIISTRLGCGTSLRIFFPAHSRNDRVHNLTKPKIENEPFVLFHDSGSLCAGRGTAWPAEPHPRQPRVSFPGAHAPPASICPVFSRDFCAMGTAPFSLLRQSLPDGQASLRRRLGRIWLSRAGIWNLSGEAKRGLRVFQGTRPRLPPGRSSRSVFESPALAARSKKIAPGFGVEVLDQCRDNSVLASVGRPRGRAHGTVLVC